jgi:cytochrome b involved in lipid metabolism
MKSKYLVGIFLFGFWMVGTALITAGLLSRSQVAPSTITCVLPGGTTNNAMGMMTSLTAEEVAKHNTASDCWSIVNSKVYNLTSLIATHSGGSQEIIRDCGRDGSVGFNTKYQNKAHSGGAKSMMSQFYLGDLGATVNAAQITTQINNNPPVRSGDREDD